MPQSDKSDAVTALLTPFVLVGGVILFASLVVDSAFGHAGAFAFDALTGFYAVFGLLAGLAIIGVAKAIGAALKRPDTYYDD